LQSIERALARGSLRRRFLELPGVAPGARGQAGARWLTVRLRFLALNQSSLDCGVATSTRAGGSGTFTEMGFANVGQGMHCCIIIGFSDRFVRPAPGGFLPSRRVDRRTAWARTVRSPQKTLGQFQQMVHEDCRNRFRRPCLHSSESKRKASSTELARGARHAHTQHQTACGVRAHGRRVPLGSPAEFPRSSCSPKPAGTPPTSPCPLPSTYDCADGIDTPSCCGLCVARMAECCRSRC